ncbi:TPA: NupC/NupG family nucleoside CNT transporter [Candidatus Gastranaerophilales bacterium HUM_10]|mgnify:FL=1|nr:MAG TPA: NupC/NupG family nucleoside CNT transporter [Candidatus Gastranaerophilales bacterium HUM_10]DAB13461.1 MAG TPA: NupC/NupG family nucleoside CNT transporter [Candidatus Gastranaerophilales bacterium HUM_16]
MERFVGLIGIVVIFLIVFGMSNNRKVINYKTVVTGFILQILLAVFIFKVPIGEKIFLMIGMFIQKILDFATEGGLFVFGPLLENAKLTELFGKSSSIFAVQLICTNIFMMVLVNILYYYGIMQRVVAALGKAMNKLMHVSGAEALSNVASSFVGQILAQIMIKPYLEKLTRSELLASMAGSMACISGAIMPIYIGMGIPAHYILASSIMAAPGAMILAKIMYPETGEPETRDNIRISKRRTFANVFEAISNGASEGMKVAINVTAMILALVALVAFIDWILGLGGMFLYKFCPGCSHLTFLSHLSLKLILGKLFAIFAIIIGVPLKDASVVGALMGTKLVLNEMVAYVNLSHIATSIAPKSFMLASFALCSFGNFGSIAIQIGGIGELAPNQKKNLARLGLRALICGTLSCYLSAAIVGVLL